MKRLKRWMVFVLVVSGVQVAYGVELFTTLRVSTPLLVSGSAGVRLGDAAEGIMRPTVQVEAGAGGGRLAIGLDNTGEAGLGYALKGAVLRTWFEPIDADEDQSFLGLEAELSIQRMILSIGGYRRISSGDDNWLGSMGIGFLF
jgi:hypothetical protein